MKAITFKNFTKESFTHSWNSDPYTFKPGQDMTMEDWKAEHFAKHLIDRELNKKGLLTNDQGEIAKLREKCLIDPETVQSESNIIDKNVRAKKIVKESKEEVEFPDLKD
jgi:hypothetical protein